MTVTIAPADEACQALVSRINTGTAYVLAVDAEYSDREVDRLEEIDTLRVDVAVMTETQPNERIDGLDQPSIEIEIVIRKPVEKAAQAVDVPALRLLCRQIFERVDNWDSSDRRVQVWECDVDEKENPDKDMLRESGLFVSTIKLRVEVAR